MRGEKLKTFILSYISTRKQAKLDAFDKDAEKKRAALSGEALAVTELELAQVRREIEQKHEVQNWLTDAASRAGQISLVTHALKFTHSDARGSSIFSADTVADAKTLSTATLAQPAIDAVGNAAALDVAKLLQTEYDGDSLVAALQRGDHSALEALAESPEQLAQWLAGFQQVFTDRQPSSHKLAKQIYFPLANGEYHLLSPLYSSSLAQALHQRINAVRFGDEAKAIRQAQKASQWHDQLSISYPNLAVQNMGGTKPQNISALNSSRSGRSYLLSSAPPQWNSIEKPPQQHESIFRPRGEVDYYTRATLAQMQRFLLSVKEVENNRDIRQQRLRYLDQLIDQLFFYVASVQNLPAGWSAESELKRAQQLWLDPYRADTDTVFRREREAGDWQQAVAYDFGRWLNRRLKHENLIFGEVERREWSTAALFKRRMREMEGTLKEELA
ncbi:type I-F CRISPR-associated protein Csy1 [Pectobacterium parmentieri]|uniref:CRISPR-associated protein, Csy1 family n=1 Tax=Pectobacterium parmentieri TaxID=1905730 RepID=A0A0H3I8N9_PECPM|nr:type I-F CRISPR-associated protein Csy1 [Pectobacterium parmentieri]AFI91858.1 CRISPR-associated protein, Csy1 family [Pectobacterium parmentieri]MBI0469176.1 type I-F CRISPR-associated protein Csy1 [Pectobacterium parmentieri]MBI0491801.1 type I-F CRISPR-associated protein Csy1 [Pectobacterium parmentieri]MBI0555286.1 type I-F CRISPR-associated protein Csy1 [Pectobacterium parmentieri]MBI0566340.1 type I-F CRISPR-associated protein Csy1 [Pectobacterium parmentieri]